jgi:ornithine cyclodeaminase/alanine dehydrogenase-like protein (mu-crystallin family)
MTFAVSPIFKSSLKVLVVFFPATRSHSYQSNHINQIISNHIKQLSTMLSSLTTVLSRQAARTAVRSTAAFATSAFPPPRLFDYETITSNLSVADAIESVEAAFGALAKGNVDVPMPMHIGIEETPTAGPGDCHIKGGYVLGAKTFTVKLACVSFYKNLEKGLPPGSGVFVVVDAVTGAPLGVFQENRFMTDLRTGAAGAVAIKYTTPEDVTVGFIGCGAIARTMARATKAVRPNYKGVCYGLAGSEEFAKEMGEELGLEFTVASSAQELCATSNAIFTQTPGSELVLELDWLQPGTTIIASGSDQPTKQEIPNDVLKASKYISDLTKQTSKVGELRGALQAGIMTVEDVYAELGEIVNGKPGREGDELIVVDLTGTGAQDAAIGQVAWDKLSSL